MQKDVKWSSLEEKDDSDVLYSVYVRKIKEVGGALFDKIQYGSSGEKALVNQGKRASHKLKYRQATEKSQHALPAIFRAVKAMEDGLATKEQSSLPYGNSANVEACSSSSSSLSY